MKKEATVGSLNIILIVIVVILAIFVLFLWNSHSALKKAFEEEENREERVYFIEEQIALSRKDVNEFCTQICMDRRYDGFVEGVLAKEGTVSFTYECSCYRIVR